MGNTKETRTHLWKLALEDIDLVEKENDGRPEEPSRVSDGLKQDERLLHSILRWDLCQLSLSHATARREPHLIPFLEEDLVVIAEGCAKDDSRDGLEAVYPLLAL